MKLLRLTKIILNSEIIFKQVSTHCWILLSVFIYTDVSATEKTYKSPESIYQIKRSVELIKKQDIITKLRDFVSCCRPNRLVGTAGHDEVATYLVSKIKELDRGSGNLLVVESFNPDLEYAKNLYQNDFEQLEKSTNISKVPKDLEKWKKFTQNMTGYLKTISHVKGKNIVWEKKGSISPKKIIIIGAHFDTFNLDKEKLILKTQSPMQGANDNGSGVALALQLIEQLSSMDLPKTVRVVFFDFQEFGALGSRAYVSQHKQELEQQYDFSGFINLDTIAYDTKLHDKSKRLGNFKLYTRNENHALYGNDLKLARSIASVGSKIRPQVQFSLGINPLERGDHVSFWQAGFPAVLMSQNWEDDHNQNLHHSENDFVETLNLSVYYHATLYVVGTVIGWAFDIVK